MLGSVIYEVNASKASSIKCHWWLWVLLIVLCYTPNICTIRIFWVKLSPFQCCSGIVVLWLYLMVPLSTTVCVVSAECNAELLDYQQTSMWHSECTLYAEVVAKKLIQKPNSAWYSYQPGTPGISSHLGWGFPCCTVLKNSCIYVEKILIRT